MTRQVINTGYTTRPQSSFIMTQDLDFLMTQDDNYIVTQEGVINSYNTRIIPVTTYS